MVEYIQVKDSEFNLLVGTASAWYPALSLGIEGGIMALANACPEECARVQQYFIEGDLKKARELYIRLFPVNKAVTETFGVAGLKYSCDLLGFEGGRTRKPLLNSTKEEKKKMTEILKSAQLI
jgi:4-hydroxy-2-oxoglutarate aldolase